MRLRDAISPIKAIRKLLISPTASESNDAVTEFIENSDDTRRQGTEVELNVESDATFVRIKDVPPEWRDLNGGGDGTQTLTSGAGDEAMMSGAIVGKMIKPGLLDDETFGLITRTGSGVTEQHSEVTPKNTATQQT